MVFRRKRFLVTPSMKKTAATTGDTFNKNGKTFEITKIYSSGKVITAKEIAAKNSRAIHLEKLRKEMNEFEEQEELKKRYARASRKKSLKDIIKR